MIILPKVAVTDLQGPCETNEEAMAEGRNTLAI